MNNKLFFILMLFATLNCGVIAAEKKANPQDSIFQDMKRVANWQWQQLDTHGWADDQKDWTNGVLYTGMIAWAKLSDDHTYKKLIRIGEENSWKIGKNRYFADDYCVGQTYVQLYDIFRNPVYISDFKNMADSLVLQPHQESLAWVNKIHFREWAWCDALYMGPPALAYLTVATGDQKYLNTAVKLWWKSSRHLYDEQEHLFFRDSRYFDQKEKNGTKVFWSRGNGWVMGGLARLLSTMPDSNKDKAKLLKQYREMAARIISLQQADGSWHASLLDPQTYFSKETSGTALFCYALSWGINAHILSYEEYYPAVSKAWAMLKTAVHPNGMLGFVQPKGASPDKVNYDATDVYGVGAFLLAGTEMLKTELSHLPDVYLVDTNSQTASSGQSGKISVSWADIEAKIKGAELKNIKVLNALTGKQVTFSVEHKGKQNWLVFNAAIPAGSQQYWLIKRNG
jgi:unsaturated rhamnogalacturonyl hydrolase